MPISTFTANAVFLNTDSTRTDFIATIEAAQGKVATGLSPRL